MPLQVGAEVEPILEHAEPLEVQSPVSAEVSLPVCVKVQPILECAEPLEVQSPCKRGSASARRRQSCSADPRACKTATNPTSREHGSASAGWRQNPANSRARRTIRAPAIAAQGLPLPAGSKVWAVCKFGSVTQGTPGIITGVAEVRFFLGSPMYLCTFANNMKVRARPKDIEPHNHAHSLEELEQSDLKSIQSRHMTLRAQQLLSRQRPARLHSPTQL